MITAEGGNASVCRADITIEEDCRSIASTCIALHGRIDILENVVGTGMGDGSPTSLEADHWDAIMDVNLKGMWMTCKHVIPHMPRGLVRS